MRDYSKFAYNEISLAFLTEESYLNHLFAYQYDIVRTDADVFQSILQEFKNYPDAFNQAQAVVLSVCSMISFSQVKCDSDVRLQYAYYVLSGKCVFEAIRIRKKVYGVR